MRRFIYFLLLAAAVCYGVGCKKKTDNTNNNNTPAVSLVDTLVGTYKLSGIREDIQNNVIKDTVNIADTTLAVTKVNDSTIAFAGFTCGYVAAQLTSLHIEFFEDASSPYSASFVPPQVWFNLPAPHDSIFFSCNYTLANGTGVYMNLSGVKTQ
jgi:hypothetical protein